MHFIERSFKKHSTYHFSQQRPHEHKYMVVEPKEYSPGDVVKILSIDDREEFRFGMRYAIILRLAVNLVDKKFVDGYDILIGSKIEWLPRNALFIERAW